MPSDYSDIDGRMEERRKTIEKTIHAIDPEELKKLGEGLFPQVDHPWRAKFFNFISENAGATFHHAMTDDRIHIIYCKQKEKGMWFLPGTGMGPLQSKGIMILKEVVATAE